MRRLLLVSQRPQEYAGVGSARWNAFRRYLPEHGWEVEVVSARPNPSGSEYAESATNRRLYAARAAVMGRAGAVVRPAVRRAGIEPEALAPSAVWTLTGRRAVRAAIARHRPDAILATSPPVAAHLVMRGLARELTVPLVCELRDNWAGNPYYDAGGEALKRIESWALEPAAAVVVVTGGMVSRMLTMHPGLRDRLHLLPNGFDPRVLGQRRERVPFEGRRLRLIHAGPLYGYPGRTIEPLLAALGRPELRDRYQLELVGPGADVPGATVREPLPWEEAIRAQAQADVGVVLYSSDRTALGTKIFELLALGKPVLALVDPGNETDALLRDLGQGAGAAQHDDAGAIAAALLRLADDPPPPVPPERLAEWDRSQVAARMAAMLDGLVS